MALSDRAKNFLAQKQQASPVRESNEMNFSLPAPSAQVTSINRLGPTAEVFNPAQEMAKKGVGQAFDTIEGLAMSMKLFNEAEKLIPATQDPAEAVMKGLGRDFGSTKVGMVTGFADEDAMSYKQVRSTFGTLLARAFGESGVVTNQDVARVMSAFPQNGDSIKVRQNKKRFIREFLTGKLGRTGKIADAARTGERNISFNFDEEGQW